MWCFGEGIGLWPWFGGFWMLIIGGGLIVLTVWGITRLTRQDGVKGRNSALDLAKERYARGEINKEEFDQLKRDLF
jgi:putative membrane protein